MGPRPSVIAPLVLCCTWLTQEQDCVRPCDQSPYLKPHTSPHTHTATHSPCLYSHPSPPQPTVYIPCLRPLMAFSAALPRACALHSLFWGLFLHPFHSSVRVVPELASTPPHHHHPLFALRVLCPVPVVRSCFRGMVDTPRWTLPGYLRGPPSQPRTAVSLWTTQRSSAGWALVLGAASNGLLPLLACNLSIPGPRMWPELHRKRFADGDWEGVGAGSWMSPAR